MEILTQIASQYQHATNGWVHYLFPLANKIFATLAIIEIAWAGLWWAIEKNEITALLSEFLRKIIILGIFYALLLHAQQWMPAILKSFMLIGAGASKMNGLYPSDIFDQGIGLASNMIKLLGAHDYFTNLFAVIGVYLAALTVVICYTLIAAQILVTQIETYIVISAGMLLLGFSASQITRTISLNYFSYAINLGIRLFILFMIVGIGSQITTEWLKEVQKSFFISAAAGFEMMGAALIFLYVVWVIPYRAQGLMSGIPEHSARQGSTIMTGLMRMCQTLYKQLCYASTHNLTGKTEHTSVAHAAGLKSQSHYATGSIDTHHVSNRVVNSANTLSQTKISSTMPKSAPASFPQTGSNFVRDVKNISDKNNMG